jgi:hypothetical protein
MNFDFDHCYNKIADPKIYDTLCARGFWRHDYSVAHPGSLTCRFLYFPMRKEFNGRSVGSYLEFCSVADIEALRQKVFKETGELVADDEFLMRPGLSLRYAGKLKDLFEKKSVQFPKMSIEFEHRNYNWSENCIDYLLGWNFLRFKVDPITGMYIWVTEYERDPNAKAPEPSKIENPNGALQILGPVLRRPDKASIEVVGDVLGLTLTNEQLQLGSSSAAYILKEGESVFFAQKSGPFVAVLIEVESLEKFRSAAQPDYEMQFRSKKALGLKLGANMWDILAIERDDLA